MVMSFLAQHVVQRGLRSGKGAGAQAEAGQGETQDGVWRRCIGWAPDKTGGVGASERHTVVQPDGQSKPYRNPHAAVYTICSAHVVQPRSRATPAPAARSRPGRPAAGHGRHGGAPVAAGARRRPAHASGAGRPGDHPHRPAGTTAPQGAPRARGSGRRPAVGAARWSLTGQSRRQRVQSASRAWVAGAAGRPVAGGQAQMGALPARRVGPTGQAAQQRGGAARAQGAAAAG